LKFNTFSLDPKLEAGIASAGYSIPTPIQTQAIPKILQGHDLIGLAQTGTGKTAAFVLPMLHRLMKGPRRNPRALIIVPTRELADQIHRTICVLGSKTGLKSSTVYGGVGMNPQVQSLRTSDIVVACPGRLIDHIRRKNVDLSHIETLVLDEADQMFDMGFLPGIRQILKSLPVKNRQTLLFSATMPSQIRHLADEILTRPVRVDVAHDVPAETISHTFFPVAQHRKTDLLIKLLSSESTNAVLVFTRTKHRAKKLGETLSKTGYPSACLQGNLSQSKRQQALDGFKSGQFRVLVATNIAARGIDVADVSHVINYDMPATTEDYIHRTGRTGRAERRGEAFTFFSDEDIQMAKSIRRSLGTPVMERAVEGFDSTLPMNDKTQPKTQSRHALKNAGRSGITSSRAPKQSGSGSLPQGTGSIRQAKRGYSVNPYATNRHPV
jgi:ATP-dependent RNA helicase RhlE